MATRDNVKRARVADRGPPSGPELGISITPRMVAEQLGPKMSVLPNGSLFCEDVPVARLGWMIYTKDDGLPIPALDSGIVYIERTEEDLFDAEALASLMGCAVCDEHPTGADDWVTPKNWNKLAHGFVTTNVRRGEGVDSDVILADLIITRADLIASIRAGKREVSAGYDAAYELTGPGQGRQRQIRFNHIALVEKGRCGPRCAIGDQATTLEEGKPMTAQRVKLQSTPRVRISDGLDDLRDKAQAAQADLEEAEAEHDAGTHIHIHTHDGGGGKPAAKAGDEKPDAGSGDDSRLGKIEKAVDALVKTVDTLVKGKTTDAGGDDDEEEKKKKAMAADKKKAKDDGEDMDDDGDDATMDKKGKARDSAALETSYTDLTAKCEILVPGFRMPTFDAEAPRKLTVDGMCKQRRRALDMAYMTKDGAETINAITGSKSLDLDSMDCKATALLFNAAAAARATANNRATTDGASKLPLVGGLPVPNVSIASINKANADFWTAQNTGQRK